MDVTTDDGRLIKISKRVIKRLSIDEQEQANNYAQEFKHGDLWVDWYCKFRDLQYLKKKVCFSIEVIRSLEISNTSAHAWRLISKKKKPGIFNDKMVFDIAWLLGCWLGDGHTRAVEFALGCEDHDVNDHLQEVAESWGMDYF